MNNYFIRIMKKIAIFCSKLTDINKKLWRTTAYIEMDYLCKMYMKKLTNKINRMKTNKLLFNWSYFTITIMTVP